MQTFLGVVTEDGKKLVLDDERGFRRAFAKYAADEVVLTLKKKPTRQGPQQLRYYRGVVVPDIARATGVIDPDDFESVHDGLAWKFLRLPDGPMGQPRRRSTSPRDMSQAEMATFIDQVILWAETEIVDCRIRRPGEVDLDRVVDPGWR